MAASMDNVFTALFQSYSASNDNFFGLPELLEAMKGNQLLASKSTSSIQELLGHVHNSLTMTKHRMEGLHLLKVIINQSSTEVFQQNAERWMRLLLQILQGHSGDQVYRFSLQLLMEIFDLAQNFSEISRVIVSSTIPELVPLLLKPLSPNVIIESIACINKCIQTYPGPVGPFKGKIETFIHKELSNNTKSKVVYQCFALLCQCGPGGSKGVKHTDNWSTQCSDLLGKLEWTIGKLYDGFETDSTITPERGDSLISQEDEGSSHLLQLKSRWLTLCGCLEALLSEKMEAPARIPVDRIIKLACRALAVNCKMVLHRPTNERMLLSSCLTVIHQAALCVLEHFIVTCRKFLLPYVSVITGLLSQELMWTQTKNSGQNMTFSVLRERVYKVMIAWLKVLDGCSGVSTESKTWIEQILHDCTPSTDSMKLTTTLGQSSKSEDVSSKKQKKKKGYQEISQGISTQKKVHLDANSNLVQAGLQVLYWFITAAGSEIDRKPLQAIHTFTIKTLLSIQQLGDKQTPIPYSVPECRASLYRVLQSCVINPHPHAPPPTHCAVRIFSLGQKDKSLQVSTVCMEAMRLCEVLLHPRAPVLSSPVVFEHVIKIDMGENPHTVNNEENNNLKKKTGENLKDKLTANTSSTSAGSNSHEMPRNVLKRPSSSNALSSSVDPKVIKLQNQNTGNTSTADKMHIDSSSDNDDEVNELDENEEVIDIASDNSSDMEDINAIKENEEDIILDDDGDDGVIYVATKHVNETDSGVDKDDVMGDGPVESGKGDADMSKTGENEEEITEGQSEEVEAMMLTFVDAEPDME